VINLIGIGDLHLDGKLSKFIPDINQVVCNEIRKVLVYAERQGVDLIVMYGDICDKSTMGAEAHELLVDLFCDYPQLKFILMKGNHDHASAEENSLRLLKKMVQRKLLKNVKVVDQPTKLFKDTDYPINILPWPHQETEANCLNIIHTEVNGAKWDHGRDVGCDWSPKHVCVAGHIHTHQVIRKTYFSGTLYQTSFGEKPEKYFHHVRWGGPKDYEVKSVPHTPTYTLHNVIIKSIDDLSQVESDTKKLYKVFVDKKAAIDADTFQKFPNVVRINAYTTKQDLEVLLQQELEIDDLSSSVNLSIKGSLKDWLTNADAEQDVKRKAWKKFCQLTGEGKKG